MNFSEYCGKLKDKINKGRMPKKYKSLKLLGRMTYTHLGDDLTRIYS